jgi:hypothetical protein
MSSNYKGDLLDDEVIEWDVEVRMLNQQME